MENNPSQDPVKEDPQPIQTDHLPEFEPLNSNPRDGKKIVIITAITLLLIGGIVGVLFVLKKSTTSSRAPIQASTASNSQKNDYSILASVRQKPDDADYVLQLMDPSDGSLAPYKNGAYASPSIIKRPNGTLRYIYQRETEDKTKYIYTTYLRDGDGAEKALYSITTNKTGGAGTSAFRSAINSEGSRVAFYVATADASGGSTEEIFLVNDTGEKEVLLSRKTTDSPWYPGYAGVLVPLSFNEDDNVLYMADHSCIDCDGPARPNLFALDIKTKKLTKEVTIPQANGRYGAWQEAGPDTFYAETYMDHSMGNPGYEEAITEQNNLYIYNAKTKKLSAVFKGGGADKYLARVVGHSEDNKTIYVQESAIEKLSGPADYPPEEGTAFRLITSAIKAIDSATATASTLSLPNTGEDKSVIEITSYRGDILYRVMQTQQPFMNSANTQKATLYILEKGKTTARRLNESNQYDFSIHSFINK